MPSAKQSGNVSLQGWTPAPATPPQEQQTPAPIDRNARSPYMLNAMPHMASTNDALDRQFYSDTGIPQQRILPTPTAKTGGAALTNGTAGTATGGAVGPQGPQGPAGPTVPATPTTLGGIKIGAGLKAQADGTTAVIPANQLQIVSGGASPSFAADQWTAFKLTLTQDATPVITNIIQGNLYLFLIAQDSAGNHNLTWPATVFNGAPVDKTPNSFTAQAFMSDDAGNLYAVAPGTYK